MENEKLLKALDNENNSSMINLTSKKIKQIKNDNLQLLQLSRETLKEFHKKLKDYRYVDELNEIQYGHYLRWIPLKNPEKIYLTKGAILLDIKIKEQGVHLLFKNSYNKIFEIKLDENMLFQKLSDQEKILLSALDYVSPN
jgi:hypothetical protein